MDLADGLILYVVFLLSTTLHEAAHAWAALKGGDPTAYQGGQVTLDPRPHIRREPVGMVLLPLLSVFVSGWPLGFASAPYNPHWAARYPRRAGWMALAGPGANLLLVLLAGLLINLGVFGGVFHPPSSVRFAAIAAGADGLWQALGFFIGAVFSLNLLLGVFNLLPVPPLDGSSALVLLLPRHLVPRYQGMLWSNPQLGLIGIFLAWQVFGRLFHPIFLGAVNLLYAVVGVSYG